MKHQVLELPRAVKRLVVVAMDVVMGLAAMWLAFTLRLDTPHRPAGAQWLVYALGPLIAMPVFIRFGLYRAIFRYTGLAALVATGQAVALYGAALFAVLLLLQRQGLEVIPRSVGILQPLLFLLLVGSSRAIARFWLAGQIGRKRRAQTRLLIYGAGSAGAQTAAALASADHYALMGFVDDDPAKAGRSINDVRVYGAHDIPRLVERLGVTDILLALPSATRERRNEIIAGLQALPVHIRTLPSLSDLASGRVTVQDFKELDVDDLLGREPVPPDPQLLARNLTGKVVLVTGAGGSIGSELSRQIVRAHPRLLLLIDHNEFGLYTIHRELEAFVARHAPDVALVPLLASVGNPARLQEICRSYRPETVYHAAAYKHVPMVEANAAEGIANNVLGTLNVVQAAQAHGARRVVLISTDKAVRPTNVMGASKRVAELVLQAAADQAARAASAPACCFAMVRFGNVLGSSGSVVPLFREQLAAGGPLTVTHPEVTRYFMTISEAAQLVLQAGAMAEGGDVFVLDMGEPVRILDLARRMVTLSGLSLRDDEHPDGDIEVAITGLRPGEKLYEELLTGDNPLPTAHPRIMRAHEAFLPWPELARHLEALRAAIAADDVPALKETLRQLVAGYQERSEAEQELAAA